MTLWQLKVFATVARESSFTEAGKVLNISQPSVSSLIIGLQKSLGVKLFEKLGVKPRLTEAGRRLLRLAEHTIATVDKIPEAMAEAEGKHRLRIGGSVLAAASFLPAAIQKFKKKHPEIEINLDVYTSDLLEKELSEGNIDLALLGWAAHAPNISTEPYHQEEIVVIAPPKHPLTKKRSVSLEQLSSEPLIVPREGMRIREILEQAFADKEVPLTPSIEIGNQFAVRDAIRNAVASGLGIGFIAKCHVTGDIKAGRIKVLKVPEFKVKRTTYIAVHKKRLDSHPVRVFKDFLKTRNQRP
ncbi:MAG TPA: LysR family transcriptional regulator [Candidatus Binatia bacterium]|jgi:DNA-binding transcriptional LysR family regulator